MNILKTQKKLTDSKRMVTVETVKKRGKSAVLAKHTANDWFMCERSRKHVTNLTC